MKTVDAALIMSFRPCPDWPESRVREAVPEEITIVDFLRADHIPPEDRLWVAVHPDFCTDSLMRLFAGDCAERALTRERDAGREPDERSWAAVDVTRQHDRGQATKDDLDAASAAALAADARAAASDAASAAAWSAASAARFAAGEAARDAARDAARFAAGEAVRDAARFAASAAAARADEVEWQCEHLAKMLEEEI
jgi:hypothetical protein